MSINFQLFKDISEQKKCNEFPRCNKKTALHIF